MELNDEEYLKYLKSLEIGDTVYPCYDAKFGRATVCTVIGVASNDSRLEHLVEGVFWGSDSNKPTTALFVNGECESVTYGTDEPTLMELLGISVEGDYHRLQNIRAYKDLLQKDYLKSLGIY